MASLVHPARLVSDDRAAIQLDDPTAHHVHDRLVVRRHHDRGAGLVDPSKSMIPSLVAGSRLPWVRRPTGSTPIDEGPCDRHPLLLASGHSWGNERCLPPKPTNSQMAAPAIDHMPGTPDDFECKATFSKAVLLGSN